MKGGIVREYLAFACCVAPFLKTSAGDLSAELLPRVAVTSSVEALAKCEVVDASAL